MHLQIDDSGRIRTWDIQGANTGQENIVYVEDIDLPEDAVPFEYRLEDGVLVHDPLVIDLSIDITAIRIIRDSLLLASDWRVSVSDYPNSDSAAWVTYRTLLRDYPSTYTPVEVPVWPEAPI